MDAAQPAQADAGPRRAAHDRRDHARRVPQAHREGRGPRAALPAGRRRPADGRGDDLDPARPARALRGPPRRPDHGLGARRGGHALATATSPTASCPTRRSTSSTRRPAGCGWRSTRCRSSSTSSSAGGSSSRSSARRCARRRTTPPRRASRPSRRSWPRSARRPAALKQQLGGGEGRHRARCAQTKSELEALQHEIEAGRARGRLRHAPPSSSTARCVELQDRLKEQEAAIAALPGPGRAAQGGGRRGRHRRDRRHVDRHPGDQAARGRDGQARPHGGAAPRAGRRPGRGHRGRRRTPSAAPAPGSRTRSRPIGSFLFLGPDRRRQDRAGAGPGRVPVRRRARRWSAST